MKIKSVETPERRILVTSALPYANGPIHIGHLVEYIQTDIWVRYHKVVGNEIYYFCADDTHGTPIMISARKEGIEPDQLIERVHAEHFRDLGSFLVEFDNYYTTNSEENRQLASEIYNKSLEKGHISRREVEQLYCEHDTMFLPDRFVRGTCPACGALDQYGDSCEICGATYRPRDLKQPACALCGNSPVVKSSEHLFFKLQDFEQYLKEWLDSGTVDEGVRRKMEEWLSEGLREWDISRDGPYFGFAIPGEKNKFFYVWLDAPVGYMASARNYFHNRGEDEKFAEFWRESSAEVYHFIGKDIVYFHVLFWPALLKAGDFRAPTSVFVHGFLTVNGEKMSKSRGTFIRAETYQKYLPVEALRFYYASRLGSGLDDLDLHTEDFVQRYNSDIVGNFSNIFSRLGGIAGKLDLRLSDTVTTEGFELRQEILDQVPLIMSHYESREFSKAIRETMALGDKVNRFINGREPWKVVKSEPEKARHIITDAFTAGRILALLLKPVLPDLVEKIERLLGLPEPLCLSNLDWLFPPGHSIEPFKHIVNRITTEQFDKIIAEERQVVENKEADTKAQKNSGSLAKQAVAGPISVSDDGYISIEDVQKVELSAGKIIRASLIEGADRLLAIELDVGEEKPRNVIAGIREAYSPEELDGLTVLCITNLKPRKMKFGTSEAMLLASGKGKELTLYTSHRQAKVGDRLS